MEIKRSIEIIQKIMELFRELLLLWGISAAELQASSAASRHNEDEEMTRLQVIEYLGITPRTYLRRVKDGTLKPRRLPGGDRYFKSELIEAYKDSIRKGKV